MTSCFDFVSSMVLFDARALVKLVLQEAHVICGSTSKPDVLKAKPEALAAQQHEVSLSPQPPRKQGYRDNPPHQPSTLSLCARRQAVPCTLNPKPRRPESKIRNIAKPETLSPKSHALCSGTLNLQPSYLWPSGRPSVPMCCRHSLQEGLRILGLNKGKCRGREFGGLVCRVGSAKSMNPQYRE